jgi:hypothetical protein
LYFVRKDLGDKRVVGVFGRFRAPLQPETPLREMARKDLKRMVAN